MPKRKKMKSYGNIIKPAFEERYINQWSNNQETREDLKMVSILLPAEGGSLLQILICEDEMYNGIFHLKKFKYEEGKESKLIVDDLDDLHDPRYQSLNGLMEQLPEIAEKYEVKIPTGFPYTLNPLANYKELPKLIME